MRVGATGQTRRAAAGRRCSRSCGAARRTPTPSGPTRCSSGSCSIKKREDFAGSLSGGQRKLLEMARALMADPELVMLDEPMAGVNPALKQSLLGHVKSLRDEGRTVLFVEHDMDMVRDISDWVIVMAQGQIVAEGPPDSVMADQRGDRRLPRRPPRHRPHARRRRRSSPPPRRRSPRSTRRSSRDRGQQRRRRAMADDRHRSDRATCRAARSTSPPPRARSCAPTTWSPATCPGVNILNGADLYCQRGRAGRDHRAQRRRQVHPAQGAVRPGARSAPAR